jgi:hypothetical protein
MLFPPSRGTEPGFVLLQDAKRQPSVRLGDAAVHRISILDMPETDFQGSSSDHIISSDTRISLVHHGVGRPGVHFRDTAYQRHGIIRPDRRNSRQCFGPMYTTRHMGSGRSPRAAAFTARCMRGSQADASARRQRRVAQAAAAPRATGKSMMAVQKWERFGNGGRRAMHERQYRWPYKHFVLGVIPNARSFVDTEKKGRLCEQGDSEAKASQHAAGRRAHLCDVCAGSP